SRMMNGFPFLRTATSDVDVPRSIPMIMVSSRLSSDHLRAPDDASPEAKATLNNASDHEGIRGLCTIGCAHGFVNVGVERLASCRNLGNPNAVIDVEDLHDKAFDDALPSDFLILLRKQGQIIQAINDGERSHSEVV